MGIIIGGIVFGTIGVYAATTLLSQSVYYNNTTSGASSTNVQGALDELYTKANTWINPSVLNGNGYYTNSARSVIATSQGILLIRNGNTHFIKANDWANEKTHIQQVFSDISCTVFSNGVICNASDFYCDVYNTGRVRCYDNSASSDCCVYSDGRVQCGL